MLQSIDNPQPMYIPTRISPDVVASSRQLIPLGIVGQAGKSFYKFDLGDSRYKAVKFYEVDVIRSINQMSETEVTDKTIATFGIKATVDPAEVVAEPVSPTINIGVAELEQIPAPVVEPEVESEPGAKFVRWLASNSDARERAEKEIATLETKGWICRGMTAVSHQGMGEYCVLYVKPQAAVQS